MAGDEDGGQIRRRRTPAPVLAGPEARGQPRRIEALDEAPAAGHRVGVKVAAAPRLAVSREDLRIARAVVAGPTLGSAVNLLVEMGTRHKIITEYAKWTARAAVNAGSPIKRGRTVRALLKEVAFSDVLDSSEPISRDEFNEWHKRETEKLRCLARPHLPPNWREAHGPEFPAGWAAKLINVYLKTAAYVGNLTRRQVAGVFEALDSVIERHVPPPPMDYWRMMKSNSVRLAIFLCATLLVAACDSASPTAPTTPDPVEPEPEPVTLTGNWRGTFTGALISSDTVTAELTQTDTMVEGNWSTPMPATFVALGVPANLNLSGPVNGPATGTAAELTFGFIPIAGLEPFFTPGCALSVSVSSVTATTMEGTWTTNMSCQPPFVDNGSIMLTRQ